MVTIKGVWETGRRGIALAPFTRPSTSTFPATRKFPRKMSDRPTRRVLCPCCGDRTKAKGALSRPAVTALQRGGRTEIHSEIHAIRRFDLPATEAGIETVQRIGKALAICFGSDPIFQQAARYSRPTTRQFEPGAGTAGIRSKRCGGRHLTGAPPSDRQR